MTVLDFAAAHPWLSVAFILAAGWACSLVAAALVKPLETWRRPGDCPRCGGTGREPNP